MDNQQGPPPSGEKLALVKKLMDDAVDALHDQLAKEYYTQVDSYKPEPIQLELPLTETSAPPEPAHSSIAKFASGLQLDDDEDL